MGQEDLAARVLAALADTHEWAQPQWSDPGQCYAGAVAQEWYRAWDALPWWRKALRRARWGLRRH